MAVYCRPRTEKKVAERLAGRGVEVYCPLQTTMRQWSDRKKKVQVPVFPSYVFVHVAEADRLTVLQDPGVMNFVYWLGKPAVIRDGEIKAVQDFLAGNYGELFEMVDLREGDRVSIRSGAFASESGIVDEVKGNRVSVLLESLGIAVRIITAKGNVTT